LTNSFAYFLLLLDVVRDYHPLPRPISTVRQWKLKPKDRLCWVWEVRDIKMAAVVMKHEDRPKHVLKKVKNELASID